MCNLRKLKNISVVLNYIILKFMRISDIKIYNTLLCILILLIAAIGIYKLNIHTRLIVDDYVYSFIYGEQNRVNSIYDILKSQYIHYFSWGGRSVAHFLAQFFLMFDKNIFNIVNTLMFVLLVMVINFHALGRVELSFKIIVLILWIILEYMPAFGQVFLWVTGACNYLWCPLISLSFLLMYRLQNNQENSIIKNKLIYFIIIVFGIIAGWTNENNSIATVTMAIIFTYKYWSEFHRVNNWSIFGIVGMIIGCALLIMAPGNFERLQVIENLRGENPIDIIKNLVNITNMFFKPDFLLYPIVLLTVFKIFSKNDNIIWVYITGMFISMYSMVGSPSFPDRAKSGPLIFTIIAVAILYNSINFRRYKMFKALIIINFAMLITIGSIYNYAKRDIINYEKNDIEKINIVLRAKEKGNLDVIVPKNEAKTKYCVGWGLEDLSNDSKYWTNISFARYFEINTVRVIEK